MSQHTRSPRRISSSKATSLRAFDDDHGGMLDDRPLAPPKRILDQLAENDDEEDRKPAAVVSPEQRDAKQPRPPAISTIVPVHSSTTPSTKEGSNFGADLPRAYHVIPDDNSTISSYIFKDDDTTTIDSVRVLKEEISRLVSDRNPYSSQQSIMSQKSMKSVVSQKSEGSLSTISGARVPPKFRPQLVIYVNGPGVTRATHNNNNIPEEDEYENDDSGHDIENPTMPSSAVSATVLDATSSGPITAEIAKDEAELEDALRKQIILEAVRAEIVEPKELHHVSTFYLWIARFGWVLSLGFILTVAITIALVVVLSRQRFDAAIGTETSFPSTVPTLAPTTFQYYERQVAFANVLLPISGDQMWEIGTPQNRAFEFLVSSDPAELDPRGDEDQHIRQRYVLMVIYFATGGKDWDNPVNFTSRFHICDWNGDSVSDGSIGVSCNKDKNVMKLDMTGNNLKGTLPSEVGYFSDLIELDVNSNQLKGKLPDSLGNLTNLARLDGDYNEFTGILPHSIFDINTLKVVWFDGNMLSGQLPPNLGNAISLDSLALEDNLLTGSIPDSISSLPMLSRLDFNSNELAGPLPTFNNASRLTRLYLRNGNFTGTIPSIWGRNLRNLQQLSLTNTQLTGSIPSELAALENLNQLEIANNVNLGGQLPQFASIQFNLEFVQIYGNALSGNLDEFLSKKPNRLRHMDLEANQLAGTIPQQIGLCTTLEGLALSDNLLTGSVPTTLGQLTNLKDSLYLYSNRLMGTIPTELGRLTRLQELSFSNNELYGNIPSEIGQSTQLFSIYLNYNNLTGTVPRSVAGLPRLAFMFLHGNNIEDDFSSSFCAKEGIFQQLGADCSGEVECPCCTYCCDDKDVCEDIVP